MSKVYENTGGSFLKCTYNSISSCCDRAMQ